MSVEVVILKTLNLGIHAKAVVDGGHVRAVSRVDEKVRKL